MVMTCFLSDDHPRDLNPNYKAPFLLFSELLNLIDLIISFQEFNKRDLSSGNYLRSDIAVLKNLIEVVKAMDSWRK